MTAARPMTKKATSRMANAGVETGSKGVGVGTRSAELAAAPIRGTANPTSAERSRRWRMAEHIAHFDEKCYRVIASVEGQDSVTPSRARKECSSRARIPTHRARCRPAEYAAEAWA